MSNLRSDSVVPSRRELLLGGLAATAAATAWAGKPDKPQKFVPDGALEKIIPDRIGDWTYGTASGLIMPPPDQLARLLYSQQVARTYVSDDLPPVMLLLAYGSSQGGMLQIHRPEICYPASGFRLSDVSATSIDLGRGHALPSRRFTARSDARVEQVLYWTRIGDYLPVTWAAQRLAVMRSNLAGYIPDGLLVRASVMMDNSAQAQRLLADFVRAMLAAMPPARRHMLAGTAAA
jgi:EpsI family protein